MLANIEIVVISFIASVAFGVVFQIRKEDLIWAGLGGMLTRIVYLILMAFIPFRIVYAGAAAFFAAAYADFIAIKRKTPATLFLYPSIVPLIPGDLIYYTFGGVVIGNDQMFFSYGQELLLALIGICVGFVLSSTVILYVRKARIKKFFAKAADTVAAMAGVELDKVEK